MNNQSSAARQATTVPVQLLAVLALWLATVSIANTQQFGRTKGNFTVAANGSANYSIPIWLPPGVAGLQPSLALNYNSGSGNGLLGVGWQLAGLSAITRCNLTFAQDTAAGSPQLASGDRFCMDAKRLRTTNGSTYGADGATYQTEIADFSNVTSHGTAGSGPSYLTVEGRDGLTYEYGNTTNSKILAAGSSSVLTWALDAVRDRNGNSITFTYTNDTTNGSYRPASIQYTATGSLSTNYGYQILFTYQSRPSSDQKWAYKVGGVNNQLNYLSKITVNDVYGTTTMVYGYTLNYVTAPTTSRLRIYSIQECASSFTDCFPATSVGYQDGATGWASEVAELGNATNLAFALPVDVNGDGIDDLVYPDPTSGHWYYELGTASGTYLGPYDTGIASTNYQSALAIDFYVKGRKDIMFPNSSSFWRVMQFVSAGNPFSYVDTTTSAAGVVPGSAIVGDVDGDGREDLVYAVSGGSGFAQPDYIYYRLNTGGAFSTTQGTLASFPNGHGCSPCIKLGNSEPFDDPGYRFNSSTRKVDFNGDGHTDFLVYLATCYPDLPSQCGTTYPITYSWQIFLSQPNGAYIAADVVNYALGTTPNVPPLTADFDGDGCTDIAYINSGFWYLQFGTCGRSGTTSVLASPVGTGISALGTVLAVDWDGDGRADLVQANTGASPHWLVARSVGNNLSANVDTGIPTGSATIAMIADINGDGLGDLIYTPSTALKSRVHSGVLPDLATGFTDAYGVNYSPSYVPLSNSSGIYTKGSSQTYPQQDYEGPLNVVSSYSASDGIGGTYTISNTYSSAVISLQGRGFEGFAETSGQDSRTGIYDYHYYSNVFPTTGFLTTETITQSNTAKHIRNTTQHPSTKTLDSTGNNQRYFPYADTVTVNSYEVEVGGTYDGELITTAVTTYNTPDSYGNFANIETTLTDEDSGSPYYTDQWTSTTAYTISAQTSTWCLNLPTQITVTNTAPSVSAIIRTTSFTPDYAYCRETQKVVEPSSSVYKVTTGYGFDSFGNVNSTSVTGIGMAVRTTGTNWGTSGQFPTQITNALSQQSYPAYDTKTGRLLSLQDPNGITTFWHYDTFARKIKEIRPDGTSTTWAYNNCTTAGCVNSNNEMTVVQMRLNSDATTLRIDNTYLDAFDRPLITSGQMLSGAYDRTELKYDNLGRVHLQGMPCTFTSCTQYWTTNYYDILGRLTESQRPINAGNATLQTTTYSYQGRTTTVTDPQSKVTTSVNLVTGSLARTIDHNGYAVAMNRDAFGSVLSATDSLSNTLRTASYAYGISPFMVSSTNMDEGSLGYTYTVDALGEITAYTDAKSQSFFLTYDALSRPQTRTEPDTSTTWTWGTTAASHNIGKLQSVSSTSATTYSEAYSYDSFGRLSNRTMTIPTAGPYAFDYAYDATTGLLSTLTYPVSTPANYRVAVGYTYQYGIPQELFDSSTPTTIWWQANTMNPRGQITQQTTTHSTGDPQIITNRAFDSVTGWESSSQTVVGSSTIENQSYLYDYVGNVTQRQDNNAGLTENVFYDNLYRLDHTVLGSTTNLQMGYDAMGNITSRSDLAGGAAWTYDPTHKHQVTQAGSSSYTYTYDADGNASTRNGSTIAWTSYNYPSSVATSTESATFDYGPDRQRWRMVYTGSSGMETTYYATQLFEKAVVSSDTYYRHYLWAGGRPVMLISRDASGAVDVRGLLTDQEGSISTIINDGAGTVLIRENFDAYGNRRDATDWSGPPSMSARNTMDTATREGYTFQTVLGSMGLNHMNGRVQDAVTGRFLSVDLRVPYPANTQSWNSYSYVRNNPVTYVDPSGFEEGLLNNVASGDQGQLGEIVIEGTRPEAQFGTNGGASVSLTGGNGGGGGAEGGAGDNAGKRGGRQSNSDSSTAQSQASDPNAGGSQLSQIADGAQALTPLADPSPSSQPVPGALTPDQIQNANDTWSDVAAAEAQLAADRAAYNANPNGLNWSAVSSDAAQAAAFLQRWYTAIGQPASPLPSPLNGQEPVSP